MIMSDNLARSVLTDALITLANVFKEAGMNPPKKILVDKPTFDKLLAESMALYNIDTKKAIAEREFSLSDIMFIVEVEKTLTTENSILVKNIARRSQTLRNISVPTAESYLRVN